ncbi:argininosuccinate lyase [Pseudooceanicola sp. C21-150M6]|uniref:argininosuccinate lyase n=1 Tax=Pseudooceanicola sp. C21-150M6 TaxID=3434355 RepID=UPI003D7F609B
MMRLLTVLCLIVIAAFVSACGVDGEPERPEPQPRPEPGISVSGYATMGVKF